MLERTEISRRAVLSGAAAGLTTVAVTGPAYASGDAGVVVPWVDQPDPIPPPLQDTAGNLLVWEELDTRITPNAEFFTIKHYGLPNISEPTTGSRSTAWPGARARCR